jgi:hypothetical protein
MHQRGFEQLVTEGEPGLVPLLLSLGSELGHAAGDGDHQALRSDQAALQIDRLTASLAGVDDLPVALQLQLISSLVLRRFTVAVDPHRVDFADLRPDMVLEELAGHPVLVAMVVAAVAQRAGLSIAVVLGAHHVLLAHRAQYPPLAISVDHGGRVMNPADLQDPALSWRCAHELSAVVLDLVSERAATFGLRPVEVRACELATALPLDHHSRVGRDDALRRARSAWN